LKGLILHVLVHPADVHDRRAAEAVLADRRGRNLDVECLLADMGYQGLACWLATELGWTLLIVKRPRRWAWVPAGFAVLPQRWVVERTFAWLIRNRRLAKDRLPTRFLKASGTYSFCWSACLPMALSSAPGRCHLSCRPAG